MSYVVRFLPEDRRWAGEDAVPLSLAAAACDILLEQPCGGRAGCGRCRVRLVDGGPPGDVMDAEVLGSERVAAGWRLGCRLMLDRHAVIDVPPASRVVAHKTFGGDDLFRDGFDPIANAGYGVALDVGSTTLAAAVVDLATGAVAGTASVLNPQVRFGTDIMTRIAFARGHPGGSRELHRVLVTAVDDVVSRAAAAAGVAPAHILELAVVGNPAMAHALQGLPVEALGVAPYQGERYDGWDGPAAALGLGLPAARAHVLPGVRAHVGSDAVAAMVVTDMDRSARPRLLLDLGTNTEIVVCAPAGILCTSAAAGPAFEGGAIRQGMRAVPGAIDQVRITPDGRLLVRAIGDGSPVGLCGSGLVDAVAELLRVGVVEPSGRLLPAAEAASRLPADLAGRLMDADGEAAVRLTDGPVPVLLTAGDVRALQLVNGSIGAGIRLLLDEAGLGVGDLEEVMLAGAFGNYVGAGSARALGLIPPVDPERVTFVGNAAGAGARLALVDRRARERAARIARAARFVELAGRADYQAVFVEMLRFPEPEAAG
jgi:uncharacterized 2Fe-2S/4Fe-4S cluster protein (DUF4445 family)